MAYGFGIVVGVGVDVSEVSDVPVVLDDGSGGGMICAALSVGVVDVALLEVASVVVVDVDVVGGGAVVRGGRCEVVCGTGVTGAEGWWRELCAVWMTAYTRSSTRMAAATPEA
ncbi:MAG: hypothetical protein KDB72_20745 [Mycobacterium sp.]|nr:hypothetical protein [Mycobacterium sp.]